MRGALGASGVHGTHPFLLAVVCLLACHKATPTRAQTIVIDGWWSADYAIAGCERAEQFMKQNADLIHELEKHPHPELYGDQSACEVVAGCSEVRPVAVHCAVVDTVAEVRDFESRLATSFATDTTCRGVRIVTLINPKNSAPAVSAAMSAPYWSLSLDFEPGRAKQPWKMLHDPAPGKFTKGEGSPDEIAHKVCAIVNERGGTLVN